jgi:exopolysaccharide biosynthesis WecB/TagA/CpsF family protein
LTHIESAAETGARKPNGNMIVRQSLMARTRFLSVDFDTDTPQAALAALVAQADARAPFAYVTNPNVDVLVRLHNEPVLMALHADAWRTFNDSRVLELLAGLSGVRLPAIPGSDLTEALFREVIRPDETVVMVGGDAALAGALSARYGLHDLRWHAPPMGLRHNEDAIAAAAAFVAANPARFVFLAVGTPQQEMVARAIRARGDAVGVGLCIGAALDFLIGRQVRAPRLLQRARLEWAWRLARDPVRLTRRYLVEGPRIFALWWQWRTARTG